MLHLFANPAETSRAAAEFFAQTALEAVHSRGRFTVAMTGGSSPKQLYELLSQPPLLEKIPWNRTFVFWGDERWVPAGDPRNNAKMTSEALLNRVPVPKEQIYPMSYSDVLPPATVAEQYEDLLRNHFGAEPPQFDLILLGLGENGHTASLFPHTPVLDEQTRWVREVYLDDQQMYRLTLTAPLINQARQIAFLLFGESKAQVLHDVMHGKYQPQELPTQLIKPTSGELHWFLDQAVAAKVAQA